jgi:hypothetical protein
MRLVRNFRKDSRRHAQQGEGNNLPDLRLLRVASGW